MGFDIVLSIFETGVTQRIESITEHLKNPPAPDEFAEFLRAEAEVFHGLSESLNLPGFGEIAQATITALEINPDKALKIGEVVLSDLQKAKAAILDGDRTRGGEASPALISFTQELIGEQPTTPDIPNPDTALELPISSEENTDLPTPNISFSSLSLREQIEELYKFLTQNIDINQKQLKPKKAKFYLKVIRCILGWFNHELDIPSQELSLSLLIPNHNPESSIESLENLESLENWLDRFIIFLQAEEKESDSLKVYRYGVILTVLLTVIRFKSYQEKSDFYLPVIKDIQSKISQLAREYKNLPPVTEEDKNWLTSPQVQKLLKIKEVALQSEIPVLENNIVEAIWGEDLTSIENESVKIGEPELIISVEDLNDYGKEIISSNSEPVKIVSQTVVETQEAIIEPVLETKKKKVEIKNKSSKESPRAKNSRSQSFVRVDVEGLQRLNYLAGELLIHQKQRTLQDTQLKQIIEQLVEQKSTTPVNLGATTRITALQTGNLTAEAKFCICRLRLPGNG